MNATESFVSRSHIPVHIRPGLRTQNPSRPRKTWGRAGCLTTLCFSTQLLSTSPSLTPSTRATALTVASLAQPATVSLSLAVVRLLAPQFGSGSVNTLRQLRQRKRRFHSASQTGFRQSLASRLRCNCLWCPCHVGRPHRGHSPSSALY